MFRFNHRYVSPPGDDMDWAGDVERQHAQHRRQVVVLAVMTAAIFVLAIIVAPAVAGFALFIVPWLLLELWNVRRTRPRMRIPDFRPPETVEIELDSD